MKQLLSLFLLAITFNTFAQDKPAYLLFNEKGKTISYEKMLKTLAEADVVLIGELHNNPISHWMQYEITNDLYTNDSNVVLGAEMFEADNQVILNEYLNGLIEARHLKAEAKLWDNYTTDYKPLLDFAKEHELVFVASNVPRRYASIVARQGVEGLANLDPATKAWMAPLPFPFDTATPGYGAMMKMGMGHSMGMNPENMVKAQAIKDATMAYFIQQNLPQDGIFIHYQGDYHSANKGGIYWYLKQANPDLNIVVVSTQASSTMEWSDDLEGVANFVLMVPETMTTTY
tara:strand:+ start:664 stop:1527 length:864 start_codon:yes stop_codon:yes gene_type:complete